MGKKIYLAENVLVKHLGGKSHHPDQQEKIEIQHQMKLAQKEKLKINFKK